MFNEPRFYLSLPWRLWQLKRSTEVFVGGGGLLNDTFSQVTIMRSAFDCAWAIRFGKPYHVIGLELGSIYSGGAQARSRFILRHARTVQCRDPESVRRAGEFAPRADVREMPDLAHDFLESWFDRASRSSRQTGHCVVNPLATPRAHPGEFATLIAALCQKYTRVTLATAQPGEEVAMLRHLPDRPNNLAIFASGDWEPPLHLLRDADAVVAERFHYIAAAAHSGARIVPVIQTQKARHLTHLLGIAGGAIEGKSYRAADVLDRLETISIPHRERLIALARGVREAVAYVEHRRVDRPVYPTESVTAACAVSRDILAWGWRQKRDAAFKRFRSSRP